MQPGEYDGAVVVAEDDIAALRYLPQEGEPWEAWGGQENIYKRLNVVEIGEAEAGIEGCLLVSVHAE